MKRILLLLAGAPLMALAMGETYYIAAPTDPATLVVNGTSGWTNGTFVPSGGVITNACVSSSDSSQTATARYRLEKAEVGFGWERANPDYYLGEKLDVPDNVNWQATAEAYNANPDDAFLFNPDPVSPCVYAVKGGAQTFVWHLTDGTVQTNHYTVASATKGRPYRIYWTDEPYNGPKVSLQGKFVKLLGNPNLLNCVYGATTNQLDGVMTVQSNKVVRGVYIDNASKTLNAVGGGSLSGQFVLAYYDTGDYRNVLSAQIIEVARPDALVGYGTIGEELKPIGNGYDVKGLYAQISTGLSTTEDNRGAYLYQHGGSQSYSPHYLSVFPLRPSVGCRWKSSIYWMEQDAMGVAWPFEYAQYENDWPESGTLYVRGDSDDPGAKIYIPQGYSASLSAYQEPEGHALAVDGGNVFSTKGAGWSLLKLTANDDIWFLPIHSVLRTDTNYFTLASAPVRVGEECRIRSGTLSGISSLATNQLFYASEEVGAYLYKKTSGPQYDVNLYYETTNATDTSSVSTSTASTSSTLPSAVFPVNVNDKDLEVWWSARVKELGENNTLPYWIDIPCLPQVYRPVWPEKNEAPTIVIASQKGAAEETIWPRYGAARFESVGARLYLADRQYFPGGTGTLGFWTRPANLESAGDLVVTNAPTSLMQIGSSANDEKLCLRIGRNENLEMLVGTKTIFRVPMPKTARAEDWTHIALTFKEGTAWSLYFNGELAQSGTFEAAAFLGDQLDDCTIGMATAFENALLKDLEEISKTPVGQETSAPLTNAVGCTTWDQVVTALEAGQNARLDADIVKPDVEQYCNIYNACNMSLDLNGHTITVAPVEGQGYSYFFCIRHNDANFTILDSVGGGEIVFGIGRDTPKNPERSPIMVLCGHFTLESGTLRGQSNAMFYRGGVVQILDGNSRFDMKGGRITGARGGGYRSGYRGGGAVAVMNGARFVMSGGLIDNCQSGDVGGAVQLMNWSVFEMNGGMITNCVAATCGGAVYLNRSAMVMNYGYIGGCRAVRYPNLGSIVVDTGTQLTLNGGVLDYEPLYGNFKWGGNYTFNAPDYITDKENGLYYITLGAATGREIAEVEMTSYELTQEEIQESRYWVLTGDELGLTGYYSFRADEDFANTVAYSDWYFSTFCERTEGLTELLALDISLTTPGAPGKRSGLLTSDTTPQVYVQNDSSKPGYNPNEEHAFITATGNGSYCTWALRGDLHTSSSSKPGVLVEYTQNGRAKMQFFHVAVTNETWPALSAPCTAGKMLPGPHPLDLMQDPWLAEDTFVTETNQTVNIGFRDRKGQLYARAAGELGVKMYYRQQEGFWYPQLIKSAQPSVGTPIPWLSLFGNDNMNPLNSEPAIWTWHAEWPKDVPEMKIGQTLYTAEDGLPGVYNMKSLALLYPVNGYDVTDPTDVVTLADQTSERSTGAYFPLSQFAAWGLSTEPNGGLVLRKGRYYFTELPPYLSSRVFYDTTTFEMKVKGAYESSKAGASILYPNVLNSDDLAAIQSLVSVTNQDDAAAWQDVVGALAALKPLVPSTTTCTKGELKIDYAARDSYALTAVGATNYVVLIENDATNQTMGVSVGDAINTHVFKVINKYHTGRIVTREDENNLLSQQLTVLNTDTFGGAADNYEFEWRSAEPRSDGTIPDEYDNTAIYVPKSYWPVRHLTQTIVPGATHHVVGEQGDTLANMVNRYWTCRYRAKDASCPAYAVMGDSWSDWSTPGLAEGWLQRVLNNVTPFNQLMTDLYENKAETAVSMIKKAGRPYTGDVALNQDALTSCGLIELYETLLNKAESMSLLMGTSTEGANKQLLLAAERLGDLYTVLGDEAYSDAKNPTIGFGSTSTIENGATLNVDYGAASGSLFCFDNQVSSLLEEELALLRGRSGVSAPNTTTAPYYNRLLWNFTKGITAGEVAYAVNYNIEGTDKVALSEEQAADLYPQGHGDAYGHYLSALKGWYRLLRNPNFTWPRAQGEMSLADSSVNVDYYEEAKFAEAAAKVAKTAADVVDLTARQAWGNTGATSAGYQDTDTTTAFGYGEWANRGAYGALVNWAVANSLLPEDATEAEGSTVDPGLKRIDRGTVTELTDLANNVRTIQDAEDRVDAGLNPLGLSDNAIPFDITPIGASDGTRTHFEQIRERAGTAVANARKVLDRAQEYSTRLRMLQETTDEMADAIDEEEAAYTEKLIGYYGTPYTGDIGTGKTYAQGYEGPDIVHYMWMDLLKFGIEDPLVESVTFRTVNSAKLISASTTKEMFNLIDSSTGTLTLPYNLTANGLVAKDPSVTGSRLRQGTIQEKYTDFLMQYSALQGAVTTCNTTLQMLQSNIGAAKTMFYYAESMSGLQLLADMITIVGAKSEYAGKCLINKLNAKQWADNKTDTISTTAVPTTLGAGMAVVTSPQDMAENIQATISLPFALVENTALVAAQNEVAYWETFASVLGTLVDVVNTSFTCWQTDYSTAMELKSQAASVLSAMGDIQSAWVKLNQCIDAYVSEVNAAEAVLAEREAYRQKWVNKLSQARYNDMFFRQMRNQALSRYTASFDLAQKYVYEAAKAYDYETTLLSADPASGRSFLKQIVASRSLGTFAADGTPVVGDTGDTGLAGILAQMDANWLVLKPRLGINNPQPYATWFSLRGECFRILPGEEGDKAWAQELTKYWTEDIQSNADFRRYCQPFQSQFGIKDKEPGLIIPFETTIDFAKNLFGNDLAGGDSAYDSTWYATRIAAAGIWFDGYNTKRTGYTGKEQLAKTPVAYLVPMGADCLRIPGQAEETVVKYSVVDQVIAAPFAIGSQTLNDLSWYPTASQGDLGGADETTKIRKHPSFRAYFDVNGGEPTDAQLDCTRLVGRSVWNTKWMLVIPAGGMNADREKALSIFINGSDQNRNGQIDLKPVSDIRIGFKTYSNSGN